MSTTFLRVVLNLDNNFEDAQNKSGGYPFTNVMLGRAGRIFIRVFTKPYIILPYGYSGQVCKLFERYIQYNLKTNPLLIDSTQSQTLWQDIHAKKMLTVAAGIKFVYRRYDIRNCPTDSCLLQMLQNHGKNFNSSDLVDMEYQLSSIPVILRGIPIWHTAQKGEKLAYEAGLRGPYVKAVIYMLEICELFLTDIDELMNFKKIISPHNHQKPLYDLSLCNGPVIRNKHLAAAAVLATRVHLDLKETVDPTDILAQLTITTNEYLNKLSACILEIMR